LLYVHVVEIKKGTLSFPSTVSFIRRKLTTMTVNGKIIFVLPAASKALQDYSQMKPALYFIFAT